MLFSLLFAFSGLAAAQEAPVPASNVMPTYLSLAPNINDFTRFADGGGDANWFVGSNNAWIVALPPVPPGEFVRAYIGAKIGRAKTRPNASKPWLRDRIEGRLYIGISQTPAFTSDQSFFLADTADIPMEGDPQTFIEGVGAGQWFWAQVPLTLLSAKKPNYLVIYSPSKALTTAATSPILAAADAESGKEPRAWNNRSIVGVPPRNAAGALETPLPTLSPALAIKLVPAAESEVSVADFSLQRRGGKLIAEFSVAGTDIAEAWVESSRDQLDWTRVSRVRHQQPYLFTLNSEKLPSGTFLRGAARDSLGTAGASESKVIPYVAR